MFRLSDRILLQVPWLIHAAAVADVMSSTIGEQLARISVAKLLGS
jgi:hypothetical protein